MASHTSTMMDPSSTSTMDSIPTDLFEQMYQHMTPGLMTPLDDWSNSDLLDGFMNTTSSLPTDGGAGDVLVVPGQQSLVQDAFLTSPCSTKDYFWTCPPPGQDLFNALSTPSISPVMAVPDAGGCDDHFGGLIDSLVVPESPCLDLLPVPDGVDLACSPLTDVSSVPTPPPRQKQHQPISPPLEMIMKLDQPVPKKAKATAPAAAQPVACHITSASTPTFVLKQPSRKRPSAALSSSDQDISSKNVAVPSDLAIKRQKNTDAARRSRLKKLQKMETMAARVAEMESMQQRLLSRVSALESDKSLLLQKETDYVSRIQQLEADLTLAQQKLSYTS